MATTNGNKVLNWALGSLATVAAAFAKVQNDRVVDKEKEVQRLTHEKEYLEQKVIPPLRKQQDSLNTIILTGKNGEIERLTRLLDLKGEEKSIVTIKPKTEVKEDE